MNNRTFWICLLAMSLLLFCSLHQSATAQENSTAPSVEQRLSDLEAYVNNSGRGSDIAGSGAVSKVPGAGPGHNAWMMISAALVLFMTLPGLALFYGGLVRSKNVLSVLAQCLGIAGMVSIMWWAFGYSWVFSKGSAFLGDLQFAFFAGVDSRPNADYSYWVSQNVFAMYQMMFAIITPGLIIGAIAERMKYSALMVFVFFWMIIVYFPLAHMVWGSTGWMNGVWNANAAIKSIDFAGGTVVHMSSGWSALVLCLILGKRHGHGKTLMPPHSMVLCMVGTGMLWVGWYGFNAGSAVAADGIAANAFTTTTLAAAVGCFSWGLIEYILKGKASILGFCSGAVAGLVVITPACGFVSTGAAVGMGIAAGVVCFLACYKLKNWLGYDDALDTFGVHAVGGTLGALLTGFFATGQSNANLVVNLQNLLGKTLWLEQMKAMVFTIVLSVIATVVLAYGIKMTLGLRPSIEDEVQGLDLSEHGEAGYLY